MAERRRLPVDCREASELATLAYARPLNLRERLRLSLHRLFCGPCRLYKRQLHLLRDQLGRLGPQAGGDDARLDTSARERIRERLRARL